MSSKVFISYRRDDIAGHAGRVYDRLEREFGRDLLFMDVDAIPLGVNFVRVLEDEVAKCDVLLAIIGPGWLGAPDEVGNRRLDNPHDFIRVEIAAALKRDIPVIPILIDGTRVPKADQLPHDLKDLAVRNGLDVRHASFHNDMDRLIRALRGGEPAPATTSPDHMRAKGRIKVYAKFIHGAPEGGFKPGAGKTEWFKDHEHGPELVVVPAYWFSMGSTDYDLEKPVHKVTIPSPFAVGRFPVTFAEWDACVADGGCKSYRPADQGWGRDRRPVIYVSWHDAKLYIDWLNAKTGKTYRLLSEAEREYVTRAGTTTPFWCGAGITPQQANYAGNRRQTVPVDSFEANPWGLFNVHGNVSEWCEDVWHSDYNGAPTDGSAWLQGGVGSLRVLRGGSWISFPDDLRAAYRYGGLSGGRDDYLGFRLARTLDPFLETRS
jgi:formylglycine-generating enzyme required for sulfatase activity